MEFKIKQLLERISLKRNIIILCATECGSRAYGLNSNQSDYDIRFIYKHREKWLYEEDYLDFAARRERLNGGLQDCPDVEPRTYTGKAIVYYNRKPVVVDWHGWDVTKAVKHLHEMNPSIVEWMFSPIVYLESSNYEFIKRAKLLLNNQRRSGPLINHYKSMAKRHYIEYIKFEKKVRLKKYLVCVRCSLMVLWLKLNRTYKWRSLIQVDFMEVLDNIKPYLGSKVHTKVIKLIEKKRDGLEMVWRREALDDFIESIFDMDLEVDDDNNEPKVRGYNRLLDSCLESFRNLDF